MKKRLITNILIGGTILSSILLTNVQFLENEAGANQFDKVAYNSDEIVTGEESHFYENTFTSVGETISIPQLSDEDLSGTRLEGIDVSLVTYGEVTEVLEIPSDNPFLSSYKVIFTDVEYDGYLASQFTVFDKNFNIVDNGVVANRFTYEGTTFYSWGQVDTAHYTNQKLYLALNQYYLPEEAADVGLEIDNHLMDFYVSLDIADWTPESTIDDLIIESDTTGYDRHDYFYSKNVESLFLNSESGDEYGIFLIESIGNNRQNLSKYNFTTEEFEKFGVSGGEEVRHVCTPVHTGGNMFITSGTRKYDGETTRAIGESYWLASDVTNINETYTGKWDSTTYINKYQSKKVTNAETDERAVTGEIVAGVSLKNGGAITFSRKGDYWVFDENSQIVYSDYLGGHESGSYFYIDQAYQLQSGVVAVINETDNKIAFLREDGSLIEIIDTSHLDGTITFNTTLEDSYLRVIDDNKFELYNGDYSYSNDKLDVDYTVDNLNENVAFSLGTTSYNDVKSSISNYGRTLYNASLDSADSKITIYKDQAGTEEGKYEAIESGDFYVSISGNESGYEGSTPITKIVVDLGAKIGHADIVEKSQTSALIEYKILIDEANNIIDKVRVMRGTEEIYSEEIIDNEYSGLIRLDGFEKNETVNDLSMEMDYRVSEDSEVETYQYSIDEFTTSSSDKGFASNLVIDLSTATNRNVISKVDGSIRIYDDFDSLDASDIQFRVIEKDNFNVAKTIDLDFEINSVEDGDVDGHISDKYNISINNINSSYRYYYLEGSLNGADWTHIQVFDQNDNLLVSNIKPSNAKDESFMTKLMIGLVIVGLAITLVVIMFFVIRRNFHHTH